MIIENNQLSLKNVIKFTSDLFPLLPFIVSQVKRLITEPYIKKKQLLNVLDFERTSSFKYGINH